MDDPREVCIHRQIGECSHCKHDLDPNHHPNNRNCPRFQAARIVFPLGTEITQSVSRKEASMNTSFSTPNERKVILI